MNTQSIKIKPPKSNHETKKRDNTSKGKQTKTTPTRGLQELLKLLFKIKCAAIKPKFYFDKKNPA